METKSRYEVMSELEEQKRQYISERDTLKDQLIMKKRKIRDMKRDVEDYEEELMEFEKSLDDRKQMLNELIKSVEDSLKKLTETAKSKS